MKIRTLLGLAAIGGVAYAHNKRGGEWTLDGIKETLRQLFSGVQDKVRDFAEQAKEQISQQQQELSVGEVQQFTVVAERMTFLVSAVARGYYLLLALAPAGSVGRARFELRRASLVLEKELS